MAAEPTAEQREGALVANRIRELNERSPLGNFDREHLQAVHGYLFQDLPHHRPGEIRGDSQGWSKTRLLQGRTATHEVHYAHKNVAARIDNTLRELGGSAGLAGMPMEALAARMARLYGDLDHAHAFNEGNSRTLREFTRSLAQVAGYELNWAPTGADVEQRNRLYVARDIAVLERAYPGLTPERGMQTNDRLEYEASIALTALRRRGADLETIVREGLTPLHRPRQDVAPTAADPVPSASNDFQKAEGPKPQTRPSLDKLMEVLRGPTPPQATTGGPEPSSMAKRLASFEAPLAVEEATKSAAKPNTAPDPAPDNGLRPRPSSSPGPGS